MCPGESGGRSAGQGGPDDLAFAILARIAGGDLPAGAELDPARLALLHRAAEADVMQALRLLAEQGAVLLAAGQWRVAEGRNRHGRDLMHWLVPVLRAVVSLAVARITPAEAAGVLAAYDRYAGLAGDGTVASRLQGYREMMDRLAAASGSQFHAGSLAGLLDQAGVPLSRMMARQMQSRRGAQPDDDLGRLAQAMMQGHEAAASAALEDHLILLSHYLDTPAPIRR